MTRILQSAALIFLIFFFGTAAYAQEDWHVSGSIVWNDDDGDRNINDEISGLQINAGKVWSDNISFEGVLGYSNISGWKRGGLEIADERHIDIAFNALFFYDRDARFSPYGLFGLGYMSVKYEGGTDPILDYKPGPDGGTPTLTAGLGAMIKLGNSDRWSLRTEYRWRTASEPKSLTDAVATIGIQYNFGRGRPISDPMAEPDLPKDTDGDGVLDMWDACPDTPAGVDVTARGCEIRNIDNDADDDRVPDSRDECPNTPTGAPVDERGCSLDSDMDGILTGQDRCPGTRPGAQVDAFGCEVSPDRDADGVLNAYDRCPSTVPGARVDIHGCEIRDVIQLPGVNFASGSDLLLPGSEQLLRDAARTLNNYPGLMVEVAGHSDNVGNPELNRGLSDRRAKTVLDHLVKFGVDPARLTFRGYGDAQPIADNSTEEGRAINRRVELRIREADE